MEKLLIELDNKDYEVKEPTMDGWAQLTLMRDLEEEEDFTLGIVSMCTDIPEDKLMEANYIQVKRVADYLSEYFISEGSSFYPEFEFDNTNYKFIDINNISFGHFIDIDNFLKKDQSYKKSRFNELMAMLYWPEGQIKYDSSKNQERGQLFKDLPVKYLQGTLRFFFHLSKRLKGSTPIYLKLLWRVKRKWKKLIQLFKVFGGGIQRYIFLPVKTFLKWMRSFAYRSYTYLTSLVTTLSSIRKKKDSSKN